MTKYSNNRNLTIHDEPKFNNWDVLTNYQLSQEYLGKIQNVLNNSLQRKRLGNYTYSVYFEVARLCQGSSSVRSSVGFR
ncbi:hypothetical protein, partial [Shewanella vesiculosa]|uniref:hypothetical protein n=1 Tax=Shewanella vesiculosa TaxID=518738 RepID=UPI00384D2267